MIGRLTGRVVRRSPTEILLDVGGVGYAVSVPLLTFCALPAEGPVSLEIHTHVREDAILLFGFGSPFEKSVFSALLSVSGIGPKVALAILSRLSPAEVTRAIAGGDAARLKSVPGVGRKIAERVVLELRETIRRSEGAASGTISPQDPDAEAESALVHLGYAESEAREAIRKVREQAGDPVPLESLLMEALRALGRHA